MKKSVVGVGHADKQQIAMMVKRLLPAATLEAADAADALAVALCHVQTEQFRARLGTGTMRPTPEADSAAPTLRGSRSRSAASRIS